MNVCCKCVDNFMTAMGVVLGAMLGILIGLTISGPALIAYLASQ